MECRDIDVPGYPLPIDPVSGWAWWRLSMGMTCRLRGWAKWEGPKRMDEVIPVIRWFIYGAIPEQKSMMNKLQAHFARMQEMASRYLEPGPYVDRDGAYSDTLLAQKAAFINDMIYMLDGPEQREAQE